MDTPQKCRFTLGFCMLNFSIVGCPKDTPQKCHFTLGFCILNFSIMGCPSPRVDTRDKNGVFVPRAFKQGWLTCNVTKSGPSG
jgi:hypothetical protein